ncbi:MAG: ferrous iron transport protein A [Clostridia bacterium]|jgi:Fe2+ transport system protein FeoA|nr:ferrous iron transport protein A [Clostridia bacterium]
MSLDLLNENQTAYIVGINTLDKNILKRLYDIGLRINSQITVVKKNKKGVMVVSIMGRIIALSYELSVSVLVKVAV